MTLRQRIAAFLGFGRSSAAAPAVVQPAAQQQDAPASESVKTSGYPPKNDQDAPGGNRPATQPVEAPRAPLSTPAVNTAPPARPLVTPAMVIEAHLLAGVPFDASPHVGPVIVPRFLVMHYTAGGTARSSVAAIADRGLSAHLFVDRDGSIIQTVPCNRAAYHAGESRWGDYNGLNSHSIGIEVANLGWLDRREASGWTRAGLGRTLPDDQVVVARHRNGSHAMAWEIYPEAQLRALDDLTRAILAAYPTVRKVVGHDDIAPKRKVDPGPAFPIARYQAMAPGR